MKESLFSGVLLVVGVLLIGGACEYYKPFSQIIANYGLPFKPVYATWAGILGVAALIMHQREEAPIASGK